MKTLLSQESLAFDPPGLGCVLFLPGLPGSGNNICDRSPYGNTGTITGATWKRLPSGLWYLDFDGSDDSVSCGNHSSLDITSAITMKIWINFTDITAQRYILSKGANEYAMIAQTADSGKIESYMLSLSPRNIVTTNALNDGVWHCVVCTFDLNAGNVRRVYVDGVLDKTDTPSGSMGSSSVALTLGRYSDGGSGFYKGGLALTQVIRRAWSPLEVMNSFHCEKHLFGVW